LNIEHSTLNFGPRPKPAIPALFLMGHHVLVLAQPEELLLSRRGDGDALLFAV
jgi:hypothetical protein